MNAYDAINRVARNTGWTGTANGMMVTYTRGNANESISVHYTRAYGVYSASTGSANGSCELGYKDSGKLQTIKNWFIEAEFMLKLTNLGNGIVPNARVAVRGEGNGVVTEVNGNVSVALDDGTTVHVAASDVSEIDDEPAIVQADTEALTNTDANGGNGTGDVLANRWDATVELNKATDACESSIVRDAHDAATARGLTGVERRTYVANYANNCQENAESQYRAEIRRVRAATGYRSITPNDWRFDVADRVGLTHRAHMCNWEYVGVQTDYGKVFSRANYRVAVTFIPGGRVAGAVRVNMDKLRSDSVEHTDNYNTIARWLDETPKHHGTGAQFDAESGRVATVTYTYQRIAANTDNPTYTNETTFGYLTRNGATNVFRALLRSARAESATTLPTHVTIDETASGKPIRVVVTGVTEGIRWRVTIENDRHYGTFVWDESSIGERRIVVPRKVERNRP